MMERNDDFVRKEYKRTLFPILFSVLGGTINTLIDGVFVTQSIGKEALAAVNLYMPVYLVLCTFGVILASGAATLSAESIGERNIEESKKIFHSAFTGYMILGVLMTAVGIPLSRPIATLLSHGGELSVMVYDYTLILMVGVIPSLLMYLPIMYLQLEGKPNAIFIMMTIMVGGDIALDYLLLFVFDMGIRGAAAATVISTLAGCAYGIIVLHRGDTYKLNIKEATLYRMPEILHNGSPSAIGNLLDSIRMIIINSMILASLGTEGMAMWAVLNSLSELSITISSGVPQAAAPMIGVYYPSKENASIRALMRLQVRWGMLLMGGYSLVLLVGNRGVGAMFHVSSEILPALICLVAYMFIDFFAGLWVKYLNAIKRVIISNIITICRKLIFPVVSAFVIFKIDIIPWLFLPVGALLTALAGFAVIRACVNINKKKKKTLSGLLLLNDELVISKKVLDFSIKPVTEEICDAAEKIKDFCAENSLDRKTVMKLSLSIEELLVVVGNHLKNSGSIDLRVFVLAGETGIQIRSAGELYNPFKEAMDTPDDPELMGVNMLMKMASDTIHYYALGMNTLHIFFENNEVAVNNNK